jgi:hypothetical protein
VYWHPDPETVPVPTELTPLPLKAPARVSIWSAAADPAVGDGASASDPTAGHEEPEGWSPARADGGFGTYWAVELIDLP